MNPSSFRVFTRSLGLKTTATALAALMAMPGLLTLPFAAHASTDSIRLGTTDTSTLNDLIRRVPIQSRHRERELAGLSAVQEQVILHERRMCGEGLPPLVQAQAATNYKAIISAVIEERISREDGRALFDRHRALLDSAVRWASLAKPDPAIADELIAGFQAEQATLMARSRPLIEVLHSARTPLINGHRLWIEELLTFGGHCRIISIGELGKIGRLAQRLERFEGYYKRDGILTDRERSELHRRMIEIHRVTIDAFAS